MGPLIYRGPFLIGPLVCMFVAPMPVGAPINENISAGGHGPPSLVAPLIMFKCYTRVTFTSDKYVFTLVKSAYQGYRVTLRVALRVIKFRHRVEG